MKHNELHDRFLKQEQARNQVWGDVQGQSSVLLLHLVRIQIFDQAWYHVQRRVRFQAQRHVRYQASSSVILAIVQHTIRGLVQNRANEVL